MLLSVSTLPAWADTTLPLPLSGEAFAVAQQAQREYAGHRYDDSATQAREAIRQRPDVLTLRLLLANALVAGGHQREALQAIDDARHDFGDQRVLMARRDQIIIAGRPFVPTPAYRAAQAAYRAYAQQDFAGAEAAARHALALNANAMSVRLLLVDALAAQHKDADAYQEIQTALARSKASAVTPSNNSRDGQASADAARDLADRETVVGARLAIPAATASALALKNGDSAQALAQAEAAIGYAPTDPTYREQEIAALFAAGQPQAAGVAASAAIAAMTAHPSDGASDSDPTGASFWVWRAYAHAQSNERDAALADANAALQRLGATATATDHGASSAADDAAAARRMRAVNARLIIADLALTLGDADTAKQALLPLRAATQHVVQQGAHAASDINAVAVTQRWHETMQLASGQSPSLTRLYPQRRASIPMSPPTMASGLTPRLSQWAATDDAVGTGSDSHADGGARNPSTNPQTTEQAGAPSASANPASQSAPQPAPQPAPQQADRQQIVRAQPPILDCTLSTYGPACMPYPFDPAFAAYQQGARAFDHGDADAAVQAAREAVRVAPDDATHQLLLIDALHAAGQDTASHRAAREAVDAGVLDALPDLQGAYLAVAANRPALAAPRFQRADAQGDLPPSAYLDAGYASLQSGADPAASSYIKRAIDANDAGTIHMIPDQLLDSRRTESEIDRRGGLTVSTSYRPGGASGLATNPGGATNTANRSLQTSVEGYWRPWGEMGGHAVEVYARASDTLWSSRLDGGNSSQDAGIASLSGAVGVRGRPIASQNLVLALEREIPIGKDATSDWLARIAYSNGVGTAIRQDVPSWWTGTFYGEAGRYLNEGKDYWTAESDLGRTYRIDAIHPEATVFPYVVIGGDYNQLTNNGFGVGIGPGVTGRYQFRQDRYHAPQSYLQGSVQYRFRVAGDARARGWFLNLTYGY